MVEGADEVGEVGHALTGEAPEPYHEAPEPYHEAPELSEAVWALWGQVHLLRQELESDRAERGREGAAASAAVAEAIGALRGVLGERPALMPEGSDAAIGAVSAFPYGLLSLPGDVERIHAALLADRAERQRFESALVPLVRREVERALGQDLGARELGAATMQESFRSGLEALRADLRAIERPPASADGPALPKVVRAALDELKFQLVEERAQREARDAAAVPVLQGLSDSVEALRSDVVDERGARAAVDAAQAAALNEVAAGLHQLRQAAADAEKAADARHVAAESHQADALGAWYAAVQGEVGRGRFELEELRQAVAAAHAAADDRHTASETQQVRLAAAVEAVRDEMAKQAARGQALVDLVTAHEGRLNQVRDELARDRQLREVQDAAAAAAYEAVQARLSDLQTAAGELQAESSEARGRRESWEAGLGGALATLHAEFGQAREEVAALQAVFAQTRREQEALAFELADAQQGVQDQATLVQAAHVETLGRLEEMMRSTVSGANQWFVRTRDELVERLDQLSATVDLGIAESMVAVLEQLRGEVEGVRQDLAALGRRQNLTAAQVRKILMEAGAPTGRRPRQ